MKKMKSVFLTLCTLLLTLSLLASCGTRGAENGTETDTQSDAAPTEAETLPETEPPFPPQDPAALTLPCTSYEQAVGSRLESWSGADEDTFRGVCSYLSLNGYTLYGTSDLNGNLSATYEKDGEVRHVYWQPARSELNISTDPAGVSHLPPKTEETVASPVQTTITQVAAREINGMGYVIRLADGSFIIYDGGYSSGVEELWDTLVTMNGGSEDVHVRLWVLTHSHDDHYPCAMFFLRSGNAKYVTVDYMMYSPVNTADASALNGGNYFMKPDKAFSPFVKKGAQVLIPHTGMTFRFCNVTVEILSTADEMFIEEKWSNFNNSSIVSRVTVDGGKSVMLLADAGRAVGDKMIQLYGDYLKSDVCQIAHHGVEDYPLDAYNLIAAGTLFYPCSQSLYDLPDRDADVRAALREAPYVREILIRDSNRFTRPLEGE